VIIFHWLQSLWWPMTGKGYALGSSWAGDTGTLAIFSLLYVNWRRHNCHGRYCPRIARHAVTMDGHEQLYCHKHLPTK
jgi:hypothetical protein